MMGFGFLFMILIWGVIIIGAIWVGKSLLNSNGNLGDIFSSGHEKSALEILKDRYARGEITREEFENMKEDIV